MDADAAPEYEIVERDRKISVRGRQRRDRGTTKSFCHVSVAWQKTLLRAYLDKPITNDSL